MWQFQALVKYIFESILTYKVTKDNLRKTDDDTKEINNWILHELIPSILNDLHFHMGSGGMITSSSLNPCFHKIRVN